MSDDARRQALQRLAAFFYSEVTSHDLPEDLADRYAERLDELARELLGNDPTPVRFMGLTPRARTFLERVGADTVGKLASMDEAERASLPGVGAALPRRDPQPARSPRRRDRHQRRPLGRIARRAA